MGASRVGFCAVDMGGLVNGACWVGDEGLGFMVWGWFGFSASFLGNSEVVSAARGRCPRERFDRERARLAVIHYPRSWSGVLA